ncbi:MAG: RluA family pseudouridine synthase [Huintestinicola sp.]
MSEPRRIIEYTVCPWGQGKAAGDYLRSLGLSRRMITRLKRTDNGMLLNGRSCRTTDILSAGDIITLTLPEDGNSSVIPCHIAVPKAYEDSDLVIYVKPHSMPVHQSSGHYTNTLANVFTAEFPGLSFRAVNRLDRDTSGLCLIAKNPAAANIGRDSVSKTYYAAVHGVISSAGTINAPIAREAASAIKRTVRDDGKPSVTHYMPIRSNGIYTLLEIHLETGRTHQIRVHFSHIGHPLAGDELYGGTREHIARQALHCGRMSLIHPITGENITVSAPLTEDIESLFRS